MKVRDFLDYIEENKIPDDAKMFIWADHGQNGEVASDANFSRSVDTSEYEEMIFEFDGYEDGYYDEEYLEEYNKNGTITAVCLYGN